MSDGAQAVQLRISLEVGALKMAAKLMADLPLFGYACTLWSSLGGNNCTAPVLVLWSISSEFQELETSEFAPSSSHKNTCKMHTHSGNYCPSRNKYRWSLIEGFDGARLGATKQPCNIMQEMITYTCFAGSVANNYGLHGTRPLHQHRGQSRCLDRTGVDLRLRPSQYV